MADAPKPAATADAPKQPAATAEPPTQPATPDATSGDTALERALATEREARKAAEKEAKANRADAERLRAIEEAQKTEQERLADRMAKVTAERDAAVHQATVLRVAIAKGVPAELVDRLRGDTEDELSADADVLLGQLAPSTPTPSVPKASPRQGAPTGGLTPAEQFAAAVKGQFG